MMWVYLHRVYCQGNHAYFIWLATLNLLQTHAKYEGIGPAKM